MRKNIYGESINYDELEQHVYKNEGPRFSTPAQFAVGSILQTLSPRAVDRRCVSTVGAKEMVTNR